MIFCANINKAQQDCKNFKITVFDEAPLYKGRQGQGQGQGQKLTVIFKLLYDFRSSILFP